MSYKPNVLMISGDPSVLTEGSPVARRLSIYAQFCERLDILVCTRHVVGERHTSTMHAHGIRCTNVFSIYRAITIGEALPQPTLVTAQDPFFLGLIGLFISRHHGVPFEVQIHTDLFDPEFIRFSLGNRFRSLLAHFVLTRAKHVRVVSERIQKALSEKKYAKRFDISVIPIPLSITPPPPSEDHQASSGSLRILTVSRLTKEKDLLLAINAFVEVYTQRPEATLTIVGDGPLRETLELYARERGVSSAVIFAGMQRDVTSYYRNADVYLSTSRYEGYGLALVEAALYHVPIVSTDVGVVKELIPSAVVPRNTHVIAEAVMAARTPSRAPRKFLLSIEESSQLVAADWMALSNASFPSHAYTPAHFIVKYVISGGTATAVNLSFLYVLTEVFSVWYVISAGLAYAAAFIVSFILQKFWTFRNGTLTNIHSQFGIYSMFGIFNMILNSSLIYFVVESTGVHYIVAQIGIGLIIALWSLIFYRILFRKKK